jgi:glutamate synthase domain-containing protein 2
MIEARLTVCAAVNKQHTKPCPIGAASDRPRQHKDSKKEPGQSINCTYVFFHALNLQQFFCICKTRVSSTVVLINKKGPSLRLAIFEQDRP